MVRIKLLLLPTNNYTLLSVRNGFFDVFFLLAGMIYAFTDYVPNTGRLRCTKYILEIEQSNFLGPHLVRITIENDVTVTHEGDIR